ncbi:Reticulocyte-binding protein-like protein [Colletotrichum chlorophyti]|uniref:Reticulocyte-binding protein-like protein n=1 Tax=Colletotrichum chlorophyti TaxID=708187 RepID=A0A1Q8S660_9PEZI|nr:Reticulocyte-binding protein-like protein [Colletotrichum chlorophyti]
MEGCFEKKAPKPLERYNPLIKSTDTAWIEVHTRFRTLLEQSTMCIQTVLDEYFTQHEAKLFLPATEPRSLRDCQEDNTRRYRTLTSSRFAGCHPPLATKFTMLYFGLPVEPVLSQLVEYAKPDFDVDDWDELYDVEVRPPLHFLTAHNQRNFGHDNRRGNEAPFSTIPVPASEMPETPAPPPNTTLALRGGGGDDIDAEMQDQCGLPVDIGGGAFVGFDGSDAESYEEMVHYPPVASSKKPTQGLGADQGPSRSRQGETTGGLQVPKLVGLQNVSRPLNSPRPHTTSRPATSNDTISRPPLNAKALALQNYNANVEKIQELQNESLKKDRWIPLYGYQGWVEFNPNVLSTFQKAAKKLLSLDKGQNSDLVLLEIDAVSRQVLRTLSDNTCLDSNSEMARYVRLTSKMSAKSKSKWFILRRGEETPEQFEPSETCLLSTLVRLSHINSAGVKHMAYVNLPQREAFFENNGKDVSEEHNDRPTPISWGSNQYMPFLTTATEVLVGRPKRPGANHCDVRIYKESHHGTPWDARWYGGIEIHDNMFAMMHPRINKKEPLKVETLHLADTSVIFYLPGNFVSETTFASRECNLQEESNDPYPDALKKVAALIMGAQIPMKKPSGYRVWRGDEYFNPTLNGGYIFVNPSNSRAQATTQSELSKFLANSVADPNGSCHFFVIQPLDNQDDSCRIKGPDVNDEGQEFDATSQSMELFKKKVVTLYKGDKKTQYNPAQDSLLITQIPRKGATDNWNSSASFVLRPDATDHELTLVRRRIVAQDMRVQILKGSTSDFVKSLNKNRQSAQQWGPRYGHVLPFRQELGLPRLDATKPWFSKPKPPTAKQKNEKKPTKTQRERTWTEQPSITDNGVYNPSIPINAPPVEDIMRIGGGSVPMVVNNVLTATEQRRLQEHYWTLSRVKIDRVTECPFAKSHKCQFTHRVNEEEQPRKHIEEVHFQEKCAWCDVLFSKNWTRKQRSRHYRTEHRAELEKLTGKSAQPAHVVRSRTSGTPSNQRTGSLFTQINPEQTSKSLSNYRIVDPRPPVGPLPKPMPPAKASAQEANYRYCDRCGRDHSMLKDRADRDHHDRVCVPLAEGAKRCTFCKTCGDRSWNTAKDGSDLAPFDDFPHKCRGLSHPMKPFCTKCGLSMKNLTDERIDRHDKYCNGYFGDLGSFCPCCQKAFVKDGKREVSVEETRRHIQECSASRNMSTVVPYDLYPQEYWKDGDAAFDPLYVGKDAAAYRVRPQQRRPNRPPRYLSYPLLWHDRPGPTPAQDPPSECPLPGCREPLFGLTPSEILSHFETKHGGMPQPRCPLCHLSFRKPKQEVKETERGKEGEKEGEKGIQVREYQERKYQVAHMECHVYKLWDILTERGGPPLTVDQEPFWPGHGLWDPAEENALDRRDKRCPHFEKCGAMVGFMNQRQWNQHMETAHAGEDFEIRSRDRERDALAVRDALDARKKERVEEGKEAMAGATKERDAPRSGLPGPDASILPAGTGPEGISTNRSNEAAQPAKAQRDEAIRREDENAEKLRKEVERNRKDIERREREVSRQENELRQKEKEFQRSKQQANRKAEGQLEEKEARERKEEAEREESARLREEEHQRREGKLKQEAEKLRQRAEKLRLKEERIKRQEDEIRRKGQEGQDAQSDTDAPTRSNIPTPKKTPNPRKTSKPRSSTKSGKKASSEKAAKAKPVSQTEFIPDEDRYCSRCFRKAPPMNPKKGFKKDDPTRKEQMDAHMDPTRSCGIHPRNAAVKYDDGGAALLPSRAGWILRPGGTFTFQDAKQRFVEANPELAGTICPVDGRYKKNNVSWKDDPNNPSNKHNWMLPFESPDEDEGHDDTAEPEETDDDYRKDENTGSDADGEVEDDIDDQEGDRTGSDINASTKRKRQGYKGPNAESDPTYRDRGEEDELSQADPNELVPESPNEINNLSGSKRKREDVVASTQASKNDGTSQERPQKKTKMTDGEGGE